MPAKIDSKPLVGQISIEDSNLVSDSPRCSGAKVTWQGARAGSMFSAHQAFSDTCVGIKGPALRDSAAALPDNELSQLPGFQVGRETHPGIRGPRGIRGEGQHCE